MHLITYPLKMLRRDPLLVVLLAILSLLAISAPTKVRTYPLLVDWPTILTLAGLLALTKGLEISGALHRLGVWALARVLTERAMAVSLVLSSALLSTLLTNDVALFVVVPLSLGVCQLTEMSVTKLVIFEALAVNAGSALTPIGNPQNLYLWQLSGVPFGVFVLHMLPLVAVLTAALIGLTAWAFPNQAVITSDKSQPAPIDRPLMLVSLVLYIPFLVASDMHQASLGLLVVFLTFGLVRPQTLKEIDWALLLVFALMFVDPRLLADLEAVHRVMAQLNLELPLHLYFTGIGISQFISNVPAVIALSEYSKDWRVLAYATNVGGFGLAIGSLANVIALRMTRDRQAWVNFHVYSMPALGLASAVGFALLFPFSA